MELKSVHPTSGKSKRVYTFDVTKAEAIFYQLVADKLIKFPQGHTLPELEELRGKEYYKYHNSWSHTTNNCIVFRNDIHDKIEQGEFKLETKENRKVLGVDVNPFTVELNTNMVSVNTRGLPRTTPWTKINLGHHQGQLTGLIMDNTH
ncbi:hypothetical protein Vadar_008193 [Vaccinium darrowii]|uniref:Uncharacterized protein n=1 Tax=Vaccinium darrowii TaxID=229202 RepID=A0ACB7WZ56_9ERIC|nr:hypothetical protein Vadar_008193 [Vaccinium darrowii]